MYLQHVRYEVVDRYYSTVLRIKRHRILILEPFKLSFSVPVLSALITSYSIRTFIYFDRHVSAHRNPTPTLPRTVDWVRLGQRVLNTRTTKMTPPPRSMLQELVNIYTLPPKTGRYWIHRWECFSVYSTQIGAWSRTHHRRHWKGSWLWRFDILLVIFSDGHKHLTSVSRYILSALC